MPLSLGRGETDGASPQPVHTGTLPAMASGKSWKRASGRCIALGAIVFSVLLFGPPPTLFAQGTGGSFGGSNFGGGGGGGGGGSYGGGSTSSYGGSSGFSYDGGGGAGGSVDLGVFAAFNLLIVFLGLALMAKGDQGDRSQGLARASSISPPQDIAAVSFGIDARARQALQTRLKELARWGDTGTPGGLAALFHETVIELRRVEKAWLYAAVINETPTIYPNKVEARFRAIVQDLRSRFQHEVVRSADGKLRERDAPALSPRPEEGAGVVVVSLVVATRGAIPDVAKPGDAAALREMMRVFGGVPASRLLALEVIWSPAEENDRMSTAELESIYPELVKIDPESITGRVFCDHCSYPYAAELLECPQCGAPLPQTPEA